LSTISIAEANFVDRMINNKYRVKMPEFLAKHDSFDNWEPERFASMEANLKQGDILFDVGAETGHMSAVYAGFVGAENLVLMESNPDNWQNIKATWDLEGLATPRDAVCALIGEEDHPIPNDQFNDQFGKMDGWPLCAQTGRIWTPRSYRYLWEHAHNTPQISLDYYVKISGIIPNAITIDVEGAEAKVLKGAWRALEVHRPLVWVSLHPDLMLEHYGNTTEDVHKFMGHCGYDGQYLATDHEVHFLYVPR
jgi:FkbM family methyltransferase